MKYNYLFLVVISSIFLIVSGCMELHAPVVYNAGSRTFYIIMHFTDGTMHSSLDSGSALWQRKPNRRVEKISVIVDGECTEHADLQALAERDSIAGNDLLLIITAGSLRIVSLKETLKTKFFEKRPTESGTANPKGKASRRGQAE